MLHCLPPRGELAENFPRKHTYSIIFFSANPDQTNSKRSLNKTAKLVYVRSCQNADSLHSARELQQRSSSVRIGHPIS